MRSLNNVLPPSQYYVAFPYLSFFFYLFHYPFIEILVGVGDHMLDLGGKEMCNRLKVLELRR